MNPRKGEKRPSQNRHQGHSDVVATTATRTTPTRVEVDSRADTCCLGQTFVMEDTGRSADVQGFSSELGSLKDIPIGTCATAIDIAATQTTIIAVFHESLYFGDSLKESLLNPNQCQANSLTVDTCPRQYSNGKSVHGIHIPEADLFLPFRLHGCISYFSSRLPTEEELANCDRVVHTSPAEWDPYADAFAEEEAIYENAGRGNTAGEAYDHRGDALVVGHTSSSNHRTKVDAATLARRWGTSVHTAENTLKASTTRAVRFFPKDGDLSRRFRTRQGQLRYPHLRTKWYTDTLYPGAKITKSIRGHTCAQIFCNDQAWAKLYVMRSEGDCGDAFNRAIREYGVSLHWESTPTMLRLKLGSSRNLKESENGISYCARPWSLTARG
jgi:hypothetical protein